RRVAAAPAVAAVVAFREAIVILRQHRAAPADDRDANSRGGFLQQDFAAARSRRRLVIAAPRQHVRIVVAAADADQLIDLVVIRRDVFVGDGPGDFPAVAL